MVFMISCKKEYVTNVYENKGTTEEVTVEKGETTVVSDEQILANNWTHVGEFASMQSNIYVWKYKSGNMVVIIENVPHDIFWSSKFAIGTTLTGKELLILKNKK